MLCMRDATRCSRPDDDVPTARPWRAVTGRGIAVVTPRPVLPDPSDPAGLSTAARRSDRRPHSVAPAMCRVERDCASNIGSGMTPREVGS